VAAADTLVPTRALDDMVDMAPDRPLMSDATGRLIAA